MSPALQRAEEAFRQHLAAQGDVGDRPALINVSYEYGQAEPSLRATFSDFSGLTWPVFEQRVALLLEPTLYDYLSLYRCLLDERWIGRYAPARTYSYAEAQDIRPHDFRQRWEQLDAELIRNVIFYGFDVADLSGCTVVGEIVKYEKTVARAESLLRDWLSPQQAAELDAAGHFHVTGCDTGTRYRIQRGTAQNVYELGADAKPKVGLCFGPAGGLVEGDVMLAQKISLETGEKAALAKANRFGHELRVRLPAQAWREFSNRNVFLTEFEEPPRRPANPQPPIDSAAWTGR